MNSEPFRVFDVSAWPRTREEQVGSKRKFWCQGQNNAMYLFKYSRRHAGEDWSEKIAAQVAHTLGLPHPLIELAKCDDERGTISLDFTDSGESGGLVHGNELLLELDENYPSAGRNFHVAQHTLDRIFGALMQRNVRPPEGFYGGIHIQTCVDVFVGYLMLDALIGNTDRHHSNWGVLVRREPDGTRFEELTPSFDHASSLGRELTDERRRLKLEADGQEGRRDQTVIGYLTSNAGRARIFGAEADGHAMWPGPVRNLVSVGGR